MIVHNPPQHVCRMNSKSTRSRTTAKSPAKRQTYWLGELFAGAGGMAWAAHSVKSNGSGFSHAWINDNDADACETFRHNLPIDPVDVHCKDVKKLKFKKLPKIDGLVFGFPCNDFSVVGDRQGISGKYGGLYQWGISALEEKKPLFFVAENVVGLSSSGNDLEVIESKMEKAGYILSREVYHFENYGVPQARRRIIIVGFRKNLDVTDFQHPEPTTLDEPITCREALRDIPKDAPNNERARQSKTVTERLKHIKPGENAFTADMPKELRLALKSRATISQIYKRLKPDEPSYTVTGSGGGGTHIYHWRENRALTNRERARLQSFPDNFEFLGGRESVRRQIGMAVPPEGAKHIFRAVLKTLKKHKIPSQC